MQRVFLGWDRPGLIAAADYLADRYRRNADWDLRGVVLVLPGRRAGRRLLEILVDAAETNRWTLHPPRIVTIGKLPELLYDRKRPFADDFVQGLAWIKAMKHLGPARLRSLIPAPPLADDLEAWLALADLFAGVHRELAAEDLSFSDVVRYGAGLPAFHEGPRWQLLAELQYEYLAVLDSVELWDQQTARRFALQGDECRADFDVVLIGTTDINRVPRKMLEAVGDRVTSLVAAPPECADRFDEIGGVRPEAWMQASAALDDDRIAVVDSPVDQAAAAAERLAGLDGRYAADEIVVGVPDESLVPYLEEQLSQCGVTTRFGAGMRMARTAPYRLLEALAEYVGTRRFAAFAALVRHPAISRLLEKPAEGEPSCGDDFLTALDAYAMEHLPQHFPEAWLGEPETHQPVQRLWERMQPLVEPFMTSERKTPADWGRAIVDFMLRVYGAGALEPGVELDRSVVELAGRLQAVLVSHRSVPEALTPRVDGPGALRIVLRQSADAPVAPPAQRNAVELVGWLDLALDDAPVLILTGFNEGIVPQSLNADLFLPNGLRLNLGLEDNDRRYARDAYALSVAAASRKSLHVIAGRRGPQGDPLAPSRLLFACDQDGIARRARRWFGESGEAAASVRWGPLRPGAAKSNFEPQRPLWNGPTVQSMRVTEFRDYLACKFRYYLRHRLRLAPVSDAVEELPRGAFGSLVHEVLCRFGKSDDAASTDGELIAALLDSLLDEAVEQRCGVEPAAAVRVQVEGIRTRLRAFARWQAGWSAQGWRIEHVEVGDAESSAGLHVGGRRMGLRGRMDRVDVSEATGDRVIFDYKTWDTPRNPDQAHRRGGEWVDLQLPLYRHLADGMGWTEDVQMGYIVLPKDTMQTGHVLAEWSDDELATADQAAADVVRGVWAGEYWPITTPPPDYSEEFAAICLDRRLGAPPGDDESETPDGGAA